jgi:hypothetical protein
MDIIIPYGVEEVIMLLPAYINVNRTGIPTISSNSVTVTTTEV